MFDENKINLILQDLKDNYISVPYPKDSTYTMQYEFKYIATKKNNKNDKIENIFWFGYYFDKPILGMEHSDPYWFVSHQLYELCINYLIQKCKNTFTIKSYIDIEIPKNHVFWNECYRLSDYQNYFDIYRNANQEEKLELSNMFIDDEDEEDSNLIKSFDKFINVLSHFPNTYRILPEETCYMCLREIKIYVEETYRDKEYDAYKLDFFNHYKYCYINPLICQDCYNLENTDKFRYVSPIDDIQKTICISASHYLAHKIRDDIENESKKNPKIMEKIYKSADPKIKIKIKI